MTAEGYEVLEASEGEEAVEIADRHRGTIDFPLTDVIMPKQRGPEVAARLRARCPELKVIFMSGYTESALIQDAVLENIRSSSKSPFP